MRRIFPAIAAGATALAVAGGTFGYTTLDKAVTLSVDGEVQRVQTMAPTVGDLLEKENIEVGHRDVIAPSLDAKLSEGAVVAVRYGREVTFTIDGEEQALWTTATSVDQAVDELAIDTTGADMSPGLGTPIGREGLDIEIATAKTVTIDAAGKKRKVTTTAQTVAGALKAAKIVVDGNDKLSVKPTARLVDGASFRYTRVTVSALTKKVTLAHKTVRKETDKLDRGEHEGGHRGPLRRSHPHLPGGAAQRQDGQQDRDRLQDHQEAGDRGRAGRHQGGEEGADAHLEWRQSPRAAAPPRAASGTGSPSVSRAATGRSTPATATTAACSSRSAPGGRTAERAMPHQNSRAEQIAVAQRLQAAAGWGQWPACSRKLGLR